MCWCDKICKKFQIYDSYLIQDKQINFMLTLDKTNYNKQQIIQRNKQ